MKNSILFINGLKCKAVTKQLLKFQMARQNYLLKAVLIILFIVNVTVAFCSCNETNKTVMEAFNLRINGKVDQAKELLENTLKTDSTNAMAHFELARTLNYINLRGSAEADYHLKKALEIEPDNIVFAYYNAGNCFLKAYIAMHTGEENTKVIIDNVCNEYLKVLELEPDYPEALMYLVEIYGMLPQEMGGDKNRAEEYTKQLEEMDQFYGAKARLVLMPQGTNMIDYWKNYIAENGESCRALKELGVGYIFNDDFENAKISFEKSIDLDKTQNIRLLDLARYYHMKVMQNRDAAETELPKSKIYIEQYLASAPEPIPPLHAYALGMLAKTEMFLGNDEVGQNIKEEAKALDPYFSEAFAIPSLAIFEPPTEINHHFRSFFSPF